MSPIQERSTQSSDLHVEKTLSVAVVVLNWNNAADTLACLKSLRTSTFPVSVVVVDNGSVDGSAEEIEASGLADTLIRTGANLGYAGGNNVGVRAALTAGHDMIMVLNNDTIAHADMTEQLLLALADAGPQGALSPQIVYHDAHDEVWFAGGVIDQGWPRHLQASEFDPGRPSLHDSEILSGCCIIASADTWRLTGVFDERYFLIFEDSDWSMRARTSGARLMICEDAVLEHRVSRSFRSGPSSLLGSYYYTRNGLRFHLSWQRRHTARFVARRVIRPAASSFRHGHGRKLAAFGVLGAIGCLIGHTGPAGAITQRLAIYLTREQGQPQ